jgi:predicted RNA-binding Zn ribbon-like protein
VDYEFDLTGGHPALNLANTVSRRSDPEHRKEHLDSYADFVSFARQSALLSPKQASELNHVAQKQESAARQAFRRTIVLREALYRAFSSIAQEKPASDEDLRIINDHVLDALQHRTLTAANGGYRWEWRADAKKSFERILWPIAQSAAELLTSDELKNVRFCEADDCEWLFLDNSRNRSRRWCDMKVCGNRAKARRHYERSHS